MVKRILAMLGLIATAGGGLLFASTRAEDPAPTTAAREAETIVCPLTGEEIEPCCCPLNGRKAETPRR